MRLRRLAAATIVAVVLAACGGDDPVVEPTGAPTSEPTAATADDGPTQEASAEDEPDAPRFGVEVCTALLPVLDGQTGGADRWAEPDVIAEIAGRPGDDVADAAMVVAIDDGCAISVGDVEYALTLVDDGDLGERAVAVEVRTSYDTTTAEFDADAIAAAVDEHRASGFACNGEGVPLEPQDYDHQVLATTNLVVVSVLCETFAYQSTWELNGWDGAALAAIGVEQWRGGEVVDDPIVLGFPEATGGLIVENLERARGPGDCGTLHRWFTDESRGVVINEVREQECSDDAGDYAEPSEWPVVYAPFS